MLTMLTWLLFIAFWHINGLSGERGSVKPETKPNWSISSIFSEKIVFYSFAILDSYIIIDIGSMAYKRIYTYFSFTLWKCFGKWYIQVYVHV